MPAVRLDPGRGCSHVPVGRGQRCRAKQMVRLARREGRHHCFARLSEALLGQCLLGDTGPLASIAHLETARHPTGQWSCGPEKPRHHAEAEPAPRKVEFVGAILARGSASNYRYFVGERKGVLMVMGSPQPTLNLDPVRMSSPGVPSAANLRNQLISASPSMPVPPPEPGEDGKTGSGFTGELAPQTPEALT